MVQLYVRKSRLASFGAKNVGLKSSFDVTNVIKSRIARNTPPMVGRVAMVVESREQDLPKWMKIFVSCSIWALRLIFP